MEIIPLYTLTTLTWSLTQAFPLLLFPSLISTLLSPSPPVESCTELETYYSRSLALSHIAIALLMLVLSGILPIEEPTSASSSKKPSAYAGAAVLVCTAYHGLSAFHLYSHTLSSRSSTGYLLGCIGNTVLFAFGLWVVMFGGEEARISRRTGQDKRTSGFPFANREAYTKKGR